MSETTGGAAVSQTAADEASRRANAAGGKQEKPTSLWSDARRQLLRSPMFLGACAYIAVVTSMALFPWLWTSGDPRNCNISDSRQPPNWWINLFRGGEGLKEGASGFAHPFGFNSNGCDYYAHAIYGARPSLIIAIVATGGVVLIGGLIGLLAGYYGRKTDMILSRVIDIFLGLPFLLGALVMLNVMSVRNVWTVAAALLALGWTTIARIMRGAVLEAKALDYVSAARSLGANDLRIMTKHILPNAIAPVVVVATILLGTFVSAEATLTFLGVGLQPPTASWGVMISSHQSYWEFEPWLLLFPCGLLVGTVLSFILAGDALRDALDPKLQ